MRQIQRDLHAALRAESIANRDRLVALLRSLDQAKVNEHPEPGGWSVGQVCEHLVKADELLDPQIAELERTARKDAGAPAREWKSSFIGGLIGKSLLNPKPLNGPKAFRPGLTPRGAVTEALIARELKFISVMDDAASLDWRAIKVASPALPSWAPKMNLGDGFRIHVIHVTRHTGQIERVIKQL